MCAEKNSLRYVVLRHDGVAEAHFDLMFESEPGGRLTTWRSQVWPLENNAPLVQIGEHRRDYLEYEGPVSGNRGHVRRVATGTFRWVEKGPSHVLIRLHEPESATWHIGPTPNADGLVAMRA